MFADEIQMVRVYLLQSLSHSLLKRLLNEDLQLQVKISDQ